MTRTENERLAVVESDVRHLTQRHEEFRAESRQKHEEFRAEVRDEFRSVASEVSALSGNIAEIKQILTKAEGGWMAVVGGWRALLFIGGGASGALTAAYWLWNWLAPALSAMPR